MTKKRIIIIGAGLAGLQCGRTLLEHNITDFIILEKNKSIFKDNSWKTFPAVVKEFGLEACYCDTLQSLHLRTIDLQQAEILTDEVKEVTSYILDPEKVYQSFNDRLEDYIKTNSYVKKLERNGAVYTIHTSADSYEAEIIIDASGIHAVGKELCENPEPPSPMYFTCYTKRYINCNPELIKGSTFIDFESPFYLMGSWIYKLNDNTVDIGIARISRTKELEDREAVKELDTIFERYVTRFSPFKEVIESAAFSKIIMGHVPLIPRMKISSENLYVIGDTKGAIPYSGYGVQNALESGNEAALSILKNKKYRYFITRPIAGLTALKLIVTTGNKARHVMQAMAMHSNKTTLNYFMGKINLFFFIKSMFLLMKKGISINKYIPFSTILRLTFSMKPTKKEFTIIDRVT